MNVPIYMGSSSGFGEGGLGGHLGFIYRAAQSTGRDIRVICRGQPQLPDGEFVSVPPPVWAKNVKYTPLRWSPALQTNWSGSQFDRIAASRLPNEPIVYHSFPGFAENSFRKVKKRGGITVLEAATTHAQNVYEVTEEEHRRFGMGGNHFSRGWLKRVLQEYELADFITIASDLQRQTFLDRGFPAEKLLYAPLGIDTNRFSPPADGIRRRTPGQPFRIVQVGQVTLRKGFLYLLEAVRRLNDPDIEIILFGGIGWRAIRHSLASYRQLGIGVRQQSGDPLSVLRDAHLCVHASVEDGFGLAPLEAMAAGLPVIVSDQTGMKDLVEHGKEGFIVPSRDADRLAEAIAGLKRNEEARRAMGAAAAAKAKQYDASACADRYAEALRPAWVNAL
ncbi:glycosyltransferase family 4 protein [Cohnella faecalis]|uniref:Glycosyltransferase n=1 Tax=Cohnella faecalis TaxID=2315694 RepID=A0A398CMV5_9BACL|nr:glycosyltransferase family 4 protein [Cohnella faecalis]RIE03805.1 glycosyltransferase [Cohnella faecalis]